MLITKLVLVGFRPLLLRDINHFEYLITSPWQLIIGANGSGKTKVLNQANPLAAVASDFIKGGSKFVEFTDNGTQYRSISSFENGAHHELWDLSTGVNLNPGRTASVHKQLCKKLFFIDHATIAVLTGQKLFTDMTALERRDWLLDLSQMDMAYSMGVYTELRTRARDAQGVVKHLGKRLADEIEKLPHDSELTGLNEKVLVLTETLNDLLIRRVPRYTPSADAIKQLHSQLDDIRKASLRILRNDLPKPSSIGYSSLEEIEAEIDRLSTEHVGIKERLKLLYADHDQYSDLLRAMESANVSGLAELEQALCDKEAERTRLLGKCKKFALTEQVDSISALSNVVLPVVLEILSEIPVNAGQRLTMHDSTTLRQHITNAQHDVARLNALVDTLSHKLTHRQPESLVECPDCSHTWHLGCSPRELAAYEAELQITLAELSSSETRSAEFIRLEEEKNKYHRGQHRLQEIFKQNKLMRPLWAAITENWQSGQYPRVLTTLLQTWSVELSMSLDAYNLGVLIAEQRKAFSDSCTLTTGSRSVFHERMSATETRINEELTKEIENNTLLGQLTVYRKNLIGMLTEYGNLERMWAALDKKAEECVVGLEQEHIQTLVSDSQRMLAQATTLLQRASAARAVIDDITSSRDDSVARAECLQMLARELSPTEGLIAEQLTHFIAAFVKQLNNAISFVWSYPLEVLPCSYVKDELDYKFPIRSHESDLPILDIAEGSTGQRDMINFAFRLVVMLYRNKTDYPLYLDELGANMDEKHRISIIEFVKHLVDTRRCSQMFFIGHYVAANTVFTRAEVCVLDPSNLLHLPTGYNKHVIMT